MPHIRSQAKKTAKAAAKSGGVEWPGDWEGAARVWIERQGETFLDEGTADVLAAIDQTNSISGAARTLGISYRHAWKLVNEANRAAGEPLVSAAVGGTSGGGAQLTPRGKLALRVFEQLQGRVRETAASLLQSTLSAPQSQSTTIHLAAAISLQEAIGQVLTEFALKQPNLRVRTVFGSSNELADHILGGAPCELFFSADESHLQRLAAAKRMRTKTSTIVAVNSLTAIGPAAKAPIKSPKDLLKVKQFVLADAAVPLGACSKSYLTRIGIYDELMKKTVFVDNSRGVMAAIRSGKADAGLAFTSDAVTATDCRVLFGVDPALASVAYWVAVCRGEREKHAQALLEFLNTPIARRCFRRCGLSQPK